MKPARSSLPGWTCLSFSALAAGVVLLACASSTKNTGGGDAVCSEPSACAQDLYAGNPECGTKASDPKCGDKFAALVRCVKQQPCPGGKLDIIGVSKACKAEGNAQNACETGISADAGADSGPRPDSATTPDASGGDSGGGTSPLGTLCNDTKMCPSPYTCASMNRGGGDDGFCVRTCTAPADCTTGYSGPGTPTCADTSSGEQCLILCTTASQCPSNLTCIDASTFHVCAER